MHNTSTGKDHPFRNEFLSESARDEAIIQLKTASGRLAADIGSGCGFFSEGLLNAGLKVTASDVSQETIDFLKKRFSDIKEFEAVLSDPGTIRLPDNYVDYAFANMHLHHAENPQQAVKEIFRILKQGGKAAITDLLLHDHSGSIKDYDDRWPGFTLPDIYDWLVNAGFKNISIEKLNRPYALHTGDDAEIIFNLFIGCGEK